MRDKTHRLPDPEEIRLYHEGKLSEARTREVEWLMVTEPLVADAVEGFGLVPAYASIPPSAVKGWNRWWIMGGLGLSLAIVVIALLVNRSNSLNQDVVVPSSAGAASTAVTSTMPDSSSFLETAEIPGDEVSDETVITFHPEPREVADVYQPSLPPADTLRVSYVVIKDYPADFLKTSGSPVELPDVSQEIRNRDFIRVGYYHLADYSNISGAARHVVSLPERHVPADRSSSADRPELVRETWQTNYLDYMAACLDDLSRGYHSRCRESLLAVLAIRPDDVNAQFYLALATYRMGLYSEAEVFFRRVGQNEVGLFDEDAKYYQALCLWHGGDREAARKLLAEVIQGGGFYVAQARDMLEGDHSERK